MLIYKITHFDVRKWLVVWFGVVLLAGCNATPTVQHLITPSEAGLQKTVAEQPRLNCRAGTILFCDHRKGGSSLRCVCASRTLL